MWDELGISPSDDPKAIRRAYAARLKALDPDRDPAAFARLRAALEWALSEADLASPLPAVAWSPDPQAAPAEAQGEDAVFAPRREGARRPDEGGSADLPPGHETGVP